MNKENTDAIRLLFPMVNSEIAKYYPTNYHITCVVRIRVSKEFVNSEPLLTAPTFIDTVKDRHWLTTVYDVVWQENMIAVMHEIFSKKLAMIQLIVENYKIVRSKQRIDNLRLIINQ